MNIVKPIQIVAISLLISSTAWASSGDNPKNSSEKNMMNESNGNMMMKPPMMNMQMMQKMMHQMYAMGQSCGHDHGHSHDHAQGSSSTGGGMGGMNMSSHMMQMRAEHMANMEQRLQNIESLLSQLVEIQKSE